MKKIFSLLTLFLLVNFLFFIQSVSANETCHAKVIVHYHRFDDREHELYAWDFDGIGTKRTIQSNQNDAFGQVYEVPICHNAQEQIGIILKEKGTWIKDGIDVNSDYDIDNKYVDISDIIGTANTKHVYIMQGAADVFYQNTGNETYFDKDGNGHVVIVYYNPNGNEGWNDFQVWGLNDDTVYDISYDYRLGISGSTNADLFKVGVINIPGDADDQLGFVVRKDSAWDIKDTNWMLNLSSDETDQNGNTYKVTGDRYINVTDVKGSGYKFIYVINGVKTIFENYQDFISESFKIDFTEAKFESADTLTVTFNQDIVYSEAGPDINQFVVTDEYGNVVPIDKITYNQQETADKTFDIILKNKIEPDTIYIVTYEYGPTSLSKTAQSQIDVSNAIFTPTDAESQKGNYTPYLVVGLSIITLAGVGAVMHFSRKK